MDRTMTMAVADDLLRWRAETPGCDQVVHLNNAGAALVPQPVRGAVRAHLDLEDRIGGYEAAEAEVASLRATYQAVGRLLGAGPQNVAIVQNSTVAFNQAISSLDLGPGDVILTTRADYASNQITYLSLARRRGVQVVRAPDAPEGGVDPEEVRRLIAQRRPALVSLTWIPTNSGLVQPAEAVGEICRDAGFPTWWMGVRQSARCRSTSAGCTVTSWPRPPASSSGGRGGSGSSMCLIGCCSAEPTRCWSTCTAPPGPKPMPSI